jgi:hypothetical protein
MCVGGVSIPLTQKTVFVITVSLPILIPLPTTFNSLKMSVQLTPPHTLGFRRMFGICIELMDTVD